MKQFIFVFLLIYSSVYSEFNSVSFDKSVNQLLETEKYRHVRVGISIRQLDGTADKVVYTKNENDLFIPASMMKLVLSAVTLSTMRPLGRFQTEVFATGPLDNGELHGDLLIVGSGDPSFSTENLLDICEQLKKLGIYRVHGNLVYDNNLIQESLFLGTNARYYNALSSALNLNENIVKFHINSENSKIVPEFNSSYISVEDHTKIKPYAHFSGFPSLSVYPKDGCDQFVLSGTVTPLDEENYNLHCAVSRPYLFTMTLFKELLEESGIQIMGNLVKGNSFPSNTLLASTYGKSVSTIIYQLNQESNNMIADTLSKVLGARFISKPGTVDKGVYVLSQFCIDQLHFPSSNFHIQDASGLSTENKLTPFQFSELFSYIYREDDLGLYVYDSLVDQGYHPFHLDPVPPDRLIVKLKTGTLSENGVNTVGGYMYDNKEDMLYSFVIMTEKNTNNPTAYSGRYTNPILSKLFESVE